MWFPSVLAVLIVLVCFKENTAKYLQEQEDNDQMIYKKYIELDKSLKNIVNSGMKMALPFIMEANEHLNLSSSCIRNLFNLVSDIRKLKFSAMKFLDSSGKLPPGFFHGVIDLIGDYDECLSTGVLLKDGTEAFHGQYCMLNVRAILPKKKRRITVHSGLEELVENTKNTSEVMQYLMKHIQITYQGDMRYGLCVPTGCTVEDVNMMATYIGRKLFINITASHCDQQYKLKMPTGTILAVSAFSVVGLLFIVGSSLDYYSRKNGTSFKSTAAKFLMCFSVLTNFPKVISTKTQDTALTSLFGIRALSIFYIILLHQYMFWAYFELNRHILSFGESLSSFFFQIWSNGFITTNVFFFLSGLLNTYTRMKMQAEGKRQVNVVQIIIHRLWRIYPTYIFSLFTFYLLANVYGPMATFMKQEFLKPCEQKWWQNLLFINNFFEQRQACMVHTWYVAADMQLFLISLLTVPVLLRNGKRGIILHVGMLVAGLIVATLWAWHKKLLPGTIFYILEVEEIEKVRNAYSTIVSHISPYFTGLIAGYVLARWKNFKIPVIYRVLGWPVAATCFLSMLFVTQKWNLGVEFTFVESAFYFGFCRFVYVLAVAWMVVCCCTGYGGIINYILSLKIWIPLSRISYMVYMISPILQIHYNATLKVLMDTDYMTLIWRHIGDIGVSCLLGLAMVVVVESPFISMEKLIFHKPSKEKVSENKEDNPEKLETNGDFIKALELVNNEKNSITK